MKPIGKMFILRIKIVFLKKIALVGDFGAILISKEHISIPQGRRKLIKSKRACPSIVITKKAGSDISPSQASKSADPFRSGPPHPLLGALALSLSLSFLLGAFVLDTGFQNQPGG